MRGQQTQLTHMYVLDLETCDDVITTPGYDYPNQRVWLGGYMNLEDYSYKTFNSSYALLEQLLKEGGNQNIEVAVHNLSFDGSFIVPSLIEEMGFEPVQGKPKPGEFSTLIDDGNRWYSITVKVTKKRKVTIWDSAKLFPMQLKFLPEVYGTPTKKIDEDSDFYNHPRPRGHIPTERELSYFYNDLRVLAETLNAHIKYEGLGFKKTQASQAFYNFTNFFKAWKLRFPALELEVDKDIRPAYAGGIAEENEMLSNKILYNIYTADINSSYPGQMSKYKLPYGSMRFKSGVGEHPYMAMFWVAKAVVRFTLKEEKWPTIPAKSIDDYKTTVDDHEKWVRNSNGLVELTFCSIDYITYQESYDFEVIEWIWTYHWAQKVQKEIKAFVEKNNEDKVKYRALARELEKDPNRDEEQYKQYLALSQRAKINNNAFYGKFGEEIIKVGKTPTVCEDGIVRYVEDREEVLTKHKRKFLPLAIAITAYARRQLTLVKNILGNDYVYGDTDSVYFTEEGLFKFKMGVVDGDIELDPLKLGAWDLEEEPYEMYKVLRPKTYLAQKKGIIHATVAGLPADKDAKQFEKKRSCLNFANFEIGLIIPDGNGKLASYRTPTGIKLIPTSFEIGANSIFDF